MFNIQAFGSNDTLTSSDILTIGICRADGSFQNYQIPNPKTNLTAEGIKTEVNAALLQTGDNTPFIDSKTGALLNTANGASIGTAYQTIKTIRTLDLSPEN